MPLIEKRVLADASALSRMLRRIASEIVENAGGVSDLALVGIRRGGLVTARRLCALIANLEGKAPPLGAIDITLYRDDLLHGLPTPEIGPTELPFAIAGRTVVLVDDVLYTGRTVRAALDALMDFGRPRAVRLAVLVDRGRRELPIRADVIGMTVATEATESVEVELSETAGDDRIVLLGQDEP
ncbi:MAG TPA: bifunctional pyr operon transcriptional regulator/uracil phosphoribosyltransferase PyrR [Kofleriaceae bacterium]|nr:bifunctional pyr operon transcriptional regulator/uracil phosphoribosyltransferase PyrR [Kofleriaceae bacterium]